MAFSGTPDPVTVMPNFGREKKTRAPQATRDCPRRLSPISVFLLFFIRFFQQIEHEPFKILFYFFISQVDLKLRILSVVSNSDTHGTRTHTNLKKAKIEEREIFQREKSSPRESLKSTRARGTPSRYSKVQTHHLALKKSPA